MSLYYFSLLSPLVQFYWVFKYGTLLAQRRGTEQEGVNLYHVRGQRKGFFVEVGVDNEGKRRAGLRSFGSSVTLEHYNTYVQLPEGWA
jgi:hypothetical protein